MSAPTFTWVFLILQSPWAFAQIDTAATPSTIEQPSQLQAVPPTGGGNAFVEKVRDEIPLMKRFAIESELQRNSQALQAAGKLVIQPNAPQVNNLQFPLRARPGFVGNNFFGISGYVDLNLTIGTLLDWNCGTRTYDLNDGSNYNHSGVDYFLWPFSWQMMDQRSIEIIAAAPGTIIGKSNGFADRSCPNNFSSDWNAVYVQHTDGTVAWYGHMVNNTLTSKAVGDSVVTGEYLGLVGSSGFSTGPHLHFELRSSAAANSQVVEAHAGACRAGATLWANQRPYRETKINRIATHSAEPNFNVACPNPGQETPNFSQYFRANQLVYAATYLSDEIPGTTWTMRLVRPDNSVFQSWNRTSAASDTYDASWWYWTWNLGSTPMLGQWRFEATLNGVTQTSFFQVGDMFANGFE